MKFPRFPQWYGVTVRMLIISGVISFDREYACPCIKTNMARKIIGKKQAFLKQITLKQTNQYADNLDICVALHSSYADGNSRIS